MTMTMTTTMPEQEQERAGLEGEVEEGVRLHRRREKLRLHEGKRAQRKEEERRGITLMMETTMLVRFGLATGMNRLLCTIFVSAPRPKRSRPSGGDAGGDGPNPDCQCGIPAIQLTTKREGPNKGRPFWTCSKGKDDGCGFFVSRVAVRITTWADCSLQAWADDTEEVMPPTRAAPGPAQVICGTSSPFASVSLINLEKQSRGGPSRSRPRQDDNQGIQCGCGTPAVQRTVQKAGPNQGKTFHTCPKPQGEQCGFFEVNVTSSDPFHSLDS
jgi:hypothetical protein